MARPVDNFDDNSKDLTKWESTVTLPYYITGVLGYPTTAGNANEVNARLELAPNAGTCGYSSADLNIDDTDFDVIFKLIDIDAANIAGADRLVFGCERSDASRYLHFAIANSFGTVQIEMPYFGRFGYFGDEPAAIPYNLTSHVWFKIRQLGLANNYDTEWWVAPAGNSPTEPGTWTLVRKLSNEPSWAGHVGGGTPTGMNPAREGIWAYSGSTGWTPKIDNFNYVVGGSPPPPAPPSYPIRSELYM